MHSSPFRLFVFAVLFQIHGGGGEGEVHAVFLHHVHDIQVQVVLHLEERSGLIGEQVGGDEEIDAGIAKAGEPDKGRALFHRRAGFQHGGQVGHQLLKLGTGGIVSDAQRELIRPGGAHGAVDDGGAAHLAVGDDAHGLIQGADLDGAEVDVDDLALHIAHKDPVAHSKGLVNEDDDAAEDVAGRLLGSQGDGQADEAGTGNDAADGEAALLRDGRHAQNDHQHLIGGVQQGEQRLIGADLLAAGFQQKGGDIRGVIQAFADAEGHGHLVDDEQEFGHGGNGPGQAGQGKVNAREPDHPLGRQRKAAEQDAGGLKVPAVGQQLREDLFAEQGTGHSAQCQQHQSADAPGRKGQPALQQKAANGKAQVLDGKDHTEMVPFG